MVCLLWVHCWHLRQWRKFHKYSRKVTCSTAKLSSQFIRFNIVKLINACENLTNLKEKKIVSMYYKIYGVYVIRMHFVCYNQMTSATDHRPNAERLTLSLSYRYSHLFSYDKLNICGKINYKKKIVKNGIPSGTWPWFVVYIHILNSKTMLLPLWQFFHMSNIGMFFFYMHIIFSLFFGFFKSKQQSLNQYTNKIDIMLTNYKFIWRFALPATNWFFFVSPFQCFFLYSLNETLKNDNL